MTSAQLPIYRERERESERERERETERERERERERDLLMLKCEVLFEYRSLYLPMRRVENYSRQKE